MKHRIKTLSPRLEALKQVLKVDAPAALEAFWQEIAKGVIILLAVLFDVWVKQKGAARAQ